jgi:signal transduction histidine kinase
LQGQPNNSDPSRIAIKDYLSLAWKSFDGLNYDMALLFADSAIQLAEKNENELWLAYALETKGEITKEQPEVALPLLRRAVNIGVNNGYDSITAKAYVIFSQIARSEGKTDSISLYLSKALDIFERINDSSGIAETYNNLGLLYKSTSEYENALKYTLDSYQLFMQLGMDSRALKPLINLGNIYDKLKDYDTALSCYDLAYEQCLRYEKQEWANACLLNKGVIYYKYGDYEKSLDHFVRVIDFNESIDDKHELILLYSNVSLVYRALGRNEEAIASVKKSLHIAEQINKVQSQIFALNNLAVYYKRDGRYREAELNYLKSLELATTSGYKLDMSRALYNLSILYEKTGDLKQALAYHRRYTNINDSILNDTKIKAIAELEAKYEKKNDEARILQLQNETARKELEKKDIRLERNTILGAGSFLVLLLVMGLVLFRLRARKNRIIAAQQIQQLEDEKKLSEAQSVILGQETERKRIAQELHDGIGILLSTAKLHFDNMMNHIREKNTIEMVKKADKLLNEASDEVRDISHNLMPGLLSNFGLGEALGEIFDDVHDAGKIAVNYDVTVLQERLPENTEIMLFRVVQELVNNTLKYSDASTITCTTNRKSDYLHLHYTDDGKGFDPDLTDQSKSLGLSGIRTRIDLMRGKVKIKSSPGEGISVLITIPI